MTTTEKIFLGIGILILIACVFVWYNWNRPIKSEESQPTYAPVQNEITKPYVLPKIDESKMLDTKKWY